MDSEDEDVSENDILDWYKNEVADIWDTATDSAFTDLSSNLTEMFRQVMNDVKQRSSQQTSSTQTGASNSSAAAASTNGHGPTNGTSQSRPLEAEPGPSTSSSGTNTVSLSSDQLMAMLEDDENWADEVLDEEEMMLSVQLTDDKEKPPSPPTTTTQTTEEDQKNVKGVSREEPVKGPLLTADSAPFVFLLLIQTVLRIIVYSSDLFRQLTVLGLILLRQRQSLPRPS